MKTLADVIAEIRAADLPARKTQEIIAACNTAARALGKPPELIPADPARLIPQLQHVVPQALGISLARWRNSLSLIRAGLALIGSGAPCRRIQRLSDTWLTLYVLLDRWTKLKLSRFLRYCTANGIEPDAVTEATFPAFREHLDAALLWNPHKIYLAAIDGWRNAKASVPGWPGLEITPIVQRQRWTLEWWQLPPSLRHDFDVWCGNLTDPVAEVPVRPVKPRTIAARDWQVRAFATALILKGLDPPTSLRDLVEIEAFKTGLRHMIERRGGKLTQPIYDLAATLKGLARHHVRMDQAHLYSMAAVIQRVQVRKRGLTAKNRTRLRPFDDHRKRLALLRLPQTLMEAAGRNSKPYKGALEAQTAVAIEILLMAPMRPGNLASLDLERNFVFERGRTVAIVLASEDVKNEEPGHFPLPSESIDLIDRYLTEFRPRLAPTGCTALFPGRKGGPKSLNRIREQISTAIRRHIGAMVNPHLFRHFGAKNHLEAHPGDYETPRRFLGHRSINTTTNFYTGLETAAAVRHYDETILRLRGKAKDDEQDASPRPRPPVQAPGRVARSRPRAVASRSHPRGFVRGRRR